MTALQCISRGGCGWPKLCKANGYCMCSQPTPDETLDRSKPEVIPSNECCTYPAGDCVRTAAAPLRPMLRDLLTAFGQAYHKLLAEGAEHAPAVEAAEAAITDRVCSADETNDGAFKNFHRLLCERFGYVHDEKDWQRDQLSLIEYIAKRAPETCGEPILRRLLWLCYTHGVGYRDDGELQDNHAQPFIDFRRDSPPDIEEKMRERGYRQLVAAEKAKEDPYSDLPVETNP